MRVSGCTHVALVCSAIGLAGRPRTCMCICAWLNPRYSLNASLAHRSSLSRQRNAAALRVLLVSENNMPVVHRLRKPNRPPLLPAIGLVHGSGGGEMYAMRTRCGPPKSGGDTPPSPYTLNRRFCTSSQLYSTDACDVLTTRCGVLIFSTNDVAVECITIADECNRRANSFLPRVRESGRYSLCRSAGCLADL